MNQVEQDIPNNAKEVKQREWSHTTENLKMLDLAVGQLNLCLKHGDDSIATLTDSFTQMAETLEEIKLLVPEIKNGNCTEKVSSIDEKCISLSAKVTSAIIAFQFYDRMSQNLCHVGDNLTSLGSLVGDQVRLTDPEEWTALQASIRARFTMEEEREIFDLIHHGSPVMEALELVEEHEREHEQEHEMGADIELF